MKRNLYYVTNSIGGGFWGRGGVWYTAMKDATVYTNRTNAEYAAKNLKGYVVSVNNVNRIRR